MTETDPTKPVAKGTNVVPLPAVAAEQRPSEKIMAFVKRHPVLTVAGAVAAGVAVSALLPRRSGSRLLGKAINLAEMAGTASMMFGREAGEKAQSLGKDARKQASELGHRAEKAGQITGHQLEKYGLAALAAAGALGRATAARAEKVSDAAVETASRIGGAATEGAHRAKAKAGEIRERIMH